MMPSEKDREQFDKRKCVPPCSVALSFGSFIESDGNQFLLGSEPYLAALSSMLSQVSILGECRLADIKTVLDNLHSTRRTRLLISQEPHIINYVNKQQGHLSPHKTFEK